MLRHWVSCCIALTGGKYEPILVDNGYKVQMKLTIRSVGPGDFGSYKCVSKNSLGDTDGSIRLYKKEDIRLEPDVNSNEILGSQQASKHRDAVRRPYPSVASLMKISSELILCATVIFYLGTIHRSISSI